MIVPWGPGGPADWNELCEALPTLEQFWQSSSGPEVLYVKGDHPGTGQTLHEYCRQRTSSTCPVCDVRAERPFAANPLLMLHVTHFHKKYFCGVCMVSSLLNVLTCFLHLQLLPRVHRLTCASSGTASSHINVVHDHFQPLSPSLH